MKLKRLLFLGLLFVTGQINAQTDFRPGYVIKLNKDTVRGEIYYRGDELMSEVCSFKINNKEKEIKYSPNDLVEYRFNKDKYFISKQVNGKRVFLEFLIKGRINIYYFRDDKGDDHYFIEKQGREMTELPYEEGIRYRNDTPYFYTSTKHIGILNFYLKDVPEFQPRIAQMVKFDHKILVKLAEDYHNKVCKDTSCIIFEKSIPWIKINLELTGGAVYYPNSVYIDKNNFQAGILAHLWIPRVNEKLYFRTGVIYSTLKSDSVKEAIYKFPIQIEYIYPKGIVRPKLAFGISLYKPFFQSVSVMGGFDIKLYKSLGLSFDYDIDFVPSGKFPLVPIGGLSRSILSHSILTGLCIKL